MPALLAAAVAVLVTSSVTACQLPGGSGSAGGGSGGGGGGSPTTTRAVGGTTTGPTAGPTTAPVTNGTPTVSFRGTSGSDRVACAAIDSEFAVGAYGGRMRWTATSARGVTLSPASGTLDEGRTVVVRVGGSSGGPFTVVVSAPNSAGSGSVSVDFSCR